jgi:hypothetical protein
MLPVIRYVFAFVVIVVLAIMGMKVYDRLIKK